MISSSKKIVKQNSIFESRNMAQIEARKMTRTQVHEKFKENFNALCNRCPHLTEREETLDDSLTNLQWLWNLNVNISNPIHDIGIHPTSNHTKRDMFPIKNHSRSFLPEKQIKTAAIQFHNNNRSPSSAVSHKKRNEFVHPYQKQNSRALPSGLIKTDFDAIKNFSSARKLSNGLSTDATHKASRYGGNTDVKPKKTSPPSQAKMIKTSSSISKNTDILNTVEDSNSEQSQKTCPLLSDAAFPVLSKSDLGEQPSSLSKPSLSVTTLVLMALQQSKNGKLSFTSICKWIQENFPFYGTCETKLQFLVENTLKRQKCFTKSPKKKLQTKKVLWEIDEQHTDLNGIQLISSVGRKRKQTTPQKVIRSHQKRVSSGPPNKRRREQSPILDDHNPLMEHAPELGSLKGDFNWGSIFDDLLSGDCLETPSVSSSSTRLPTSTLTSSTDSRTYSAEEDPIATFLLRDPALLSSGRSDSNNENADLLLHTVPTSVASNKMKLEPPPLLDMEDYQTSTFDEYDFSEHFPKSNSLNSSLTDIFQTHDVDLTITGHHIAEPPDWIPAGADLDAILCETNDLNLPTSQSFLFP